MKTGAFCHRALWIVAMAALLQGCGPKSSSTSGKDGGPVPTSKMTIDLTAESSEPGLTVVRANLHDDKPGGDTFRLDGGDFLRACLNNVCRPMADNDSIISPDYIARFDFQPGVDHVVSFNRQAGRNAPDSHVALPPAFTIVTPANHQMVTDGDVVIVEWSPIGTPAAVSMKYEADCTSSATAHIFTFGALGTDSNRDGRETVDIDRIVTFARSNTTADVTSCDIDVTVSHELQGHVDPAFDGGTARGIVSRKVKLEYVRS